MKNSIPENVKTVLNEIGETQNSATWDCHGTVVILHKALEKVAAHKGITFDAPVVIESSVEKKMVVMLVTGRFGDKVEWSFGEAAPYNLKNNYPFAMAEKRAKDRVILKLVGLHGDAYSEIEADEFKESKPTDATVELVVPVSEHIKNIWDSAIADEDALSLGALCAAVSEEQETWLNNSFPTGKISANKAMVKKLCAQSVFDWANLSGDVSAMIKVADAPGLLQATGELQAHEKHHLARLINEQEVKKLADLLSSLEAA